jgi:1-acyl-sn-glycerol-3-phosphate acyltransferase
MDRLGRFLEELARSVAAAAVLGPLLIGVSAGAILQRALFRTPPSDMNWPYTVFARAFVAISGAPLWVYGKEHLRAGEAYVVVSNHESNLDPFAIMDGIRELVIRFVVKRQLAVVPIFGQALVVTGNASVERRGRGRGDMRRIREVVSRRDPRVSLLFFAEGTRSKDGRLHPFKRGAFATAISTGMPLLPVGVAGTYAVLRPGRWWFRRGGMAVEIGAPILVTEHADRDALQEETFAVVAKLRAQARARLRAADIDPGGRDD